MCGFKVSCTNVLFQSFIALMCGFKVSSHECAVSRVFKVLKVLRVLKVLKVSASTHRVPKINDQIVYFGRAEVQVAFNDRAERYHSRNLVTERGASSKQQQRCFPITNYQLPITNLECDLIVEREVTSLV